MSFRRRLATRRLDHAITPSTFVATALAESRSWTSRSHRGKSSNQCLPPHGQFGYRTELPIEQRLRDVLGPQMGGRTAQVMKLIIFRQKVGRELAP